MKSLSVFRTAFNAVSHRYTKATVTTLILVAVLLTAYFFFSQSRGSRLDERQSRALERIQNQLMINLEGFKTLALSKVDAALKRYHKELPQKEEMTDEKRREIMADLNRGERLDSGFLVLKDFGKVDWEPNIPESGIAVVKRTSNDDSLFLINVYYPIDNHLVEFEFVISIRSLLRPLLRTDIFDRFLVLQEQRILYESKPTGFSRITYDTADNSIVAITDANTVRYVTINGVKNRVYSVGFEINGEPGWSILGLKTQDAFETERKTLPRAYLFAVFIIGVFMILAFPFLKSMVMSRTERLSTIDALFSAISLALGTSVIAILLIDGYLHVQIDNEERSSQLSALAGEVEQHIISEVAAMTRELGDFRKYVSSLPVPPDSCHRSTDQCPDSLVCRIHDWDSLTRNYNPVNYPFYKNMFLVNCDGYSAFDQMEPHTSFKVTRREYVRALLNGQYMSHPDINTFFYLSGIVSWREQQFRGVVSVPVLDADTSFTHVAAMTSRLLTVNDLILPEDYGFAIFDQSGNVIFHSDSTRCLNENILEECNYRSELSAAITGRTYTSFDADYSGTWHNFYVKPIQNLPYFVAAFSKEAPADAIHGQVFGIAFILQILLFSFYIAVILVGISMLRRRSRLHVPLIELSSFIPSDQSKHRYMRAVIFNTGLLLILFTGVCIIDRSLSVVALLFIAAPFTIFLNMTLLSPMKLKNFVRSAHVRMSYATLLALLLINAITFFTFSLSVYAVLFLIQAAILLFYLLVENRIRIEAIDEWINQRTKAWDYKFYYSMVIYIIVLATCVLPATSFATLAYDKEKELQVKIAQLGILQDVKETGYIERIRQNKLHALSAYHSSLFHTTIKSCPPDSLQPDFTYNAYDSLCNFMRGLIQSSGSRYNHLKSASIEGLWYWDRSDSDISLIGRRHQPGGVSSAFRITSKVTEYSVPVPLKDPLELVLTFYGALGTAIVLLYYVLKFFTNKIFVLQKYSTKQVIQLDEAFIDRTEPDYKAFITGLPSAGKSAYFRKILHGHKAVYIDFMQTPVDKWKTQAESFGDAEAVIVLDHFEHDILNEQLNEQKLVLIESLVSAKKKKVIIISSVQPAVFVNRLLPEEKSDAEETKVKNEEQVRAHERWNRVLAAFYNYTFPLSGYGKEEKWEQKFSKSARAQLRIPGKLVALIESECDHGPFMRAIGIELLTELHNSTEVEQKMDRDKKWEKREEIILRVQKLSENYYRSLWNHLAVEEQFVLYDLAQDGLVNSKNIDIVEALIDKGLIVYDNKLQIMNRSFRNYVVTVVGPSDLGKLELQVKDAGTWSKIKLPLFMLICALFLFVMKSDRSSLFSYFTAFMAIIPAVVTLFGYFGYANRKE